MYWILRCIKTYRYLFYLSELFLEEEAVERLHDFEEECMDSYFREKQQEFETGHQERIRVTSERYL